MIEINMGMQPMPQYLIDFHKKDMEQQKSQEENIIGEQTQFYTFSVKTAKI
jgi:hypothetical protein